MTKTEEEKKQHKKEVFRAYVEKNRDSIKIKQTIWRLENKEKRHKQQRERSQAFKRRAIEYLGGFCNHCGGVFPQAVYDFHHRNPEHKELAISKMLSYSWDNIKLELDKCMLLCSNCHRIEHNKE